MSLAVGTLWELVPERRRLMGHWGNSVRQLKLEQGLSCTPVL